MTGGAELGHDRLLVAQERTTEVGDHALEDLALVELVVGEAEARTRLQLPARAGEPAVVRVVPKRLVDDAHVVGPRQHLLVARLHVVRLVERVDDGLPVRRYHRGEVRTELHLVEVVRTEELRERIEEIEQRLGSRVEVDEDETPPALGPHRAQREVVGDAVEVRGVDDFDDATVERVAPAVERAPERSVDVPLSLSETRAAVQARIRERADRVGTAPHDDDGFVADRVLDEVADVRDLLLAAGDLPGARPHPLVLEVEELPRQVALLGDQRVHAVVTCSPRPSLDLPNLAPKGEIGD